VFVIWQPEKSQKPNSTEIGTKLESITLKTDNFSGSALLGSLGLAIFHPTLQWGLAKLFISVLSHYKFDKHEDKLPIDLDRVLRTNKYEDGTSNWHVL